MKITFPHMGTMSIAVKAMFKELGLDVIEPPPITSRTMALGVRHSPEYACLPLKINVGNFLEAIEKGADTIAMLGGVGPCRFGYYGQVEREILRDLGFKGDFIIIEPPQGRISDFVYRLHKAFPNVSAVAALRGVRFGWEKLKAVDTMERELLKVRPYESKKGEATEVYNCVLRELDEASTIKDVRNILKNGLNQLRDLKKEKEDKVKPLKVALIGEIYLMLEPFSNLDTARILGELGVEVTKTEYLTDYVLLNIFKFKGMRDLKRLARPYLKNEIGGHGINSVANAVKYSKLGYNGIVHIFPFTCMPEIVAQGILHKISEDFRIPIISLSFDEHSGKAGLQTRLEAFVDLLERRREKEAKLGEGLSWN